MKDFFELVTCRLVEECEEVVVVVDGVTGRAAISARAAPLGPLPDVTVVVVAIFVVRSEVAVEVLPPEALLFPRCRSFQQDPLLPRYRSASAERGFGFLLSESENMIINNIL